MDGPHRLDTEGSRDRGSCLGGTVRWSESTGLREESANEITRTSQTHWRPVNLRGNTWLSSRPWIDISH